jgi:hypothetical protein
MLNTLQTLQSIEGVLKDLLLKLGVTEAQSDTRLGVTDKESRRRKLLRMAIQELQKLDSGGAAMSLEETYVGKDPMADYMNRFR